MAPKTPSLTRSSEPRDRRSKLRNSCKSVNLFKVAKRFTYVDPGVRIFKQNKIIYLLYTLQTDGYIQL